MIFLKKGEEKAPGKRIHRATSPEAREDQLISLAVDRAEELLRSGNAPTSIIVHYLKLGTTKERIEKEILEAQKELYIAKTDAIKASKEMGELYKSAMDAMRAYHGQTDDDDEEELY